MMTKIQQYTYALEAYGYVVTMQPIAGSEHLFEASLKEAFERVKAHAELNAKRYNLRGRSKRALEILYAGLPVPVWGVEVR